MKYTLASGICLLIIFNFSVAAQKTWIGKGNGGAGTDFNTSGNWSPAGVPGPTDNVTIPLTSSATITLSANSNVKNLIYTVTGNNKVGIIDVGIFKLTVNGTATLDVPSGNVATYAYLGVNSSLAAGIVDFKGDVNYGPTNLSAPSPEFIGNSFSRMIFRGNLSFGPEAYLYASDGPGTVEFDGTGTQTITWNNNNWNVAFNSIVIGNTNNPTVVQTAGTNTPDNLAGNLTLNGSTVLDLGTTIWNRAGTGGTLTLNGSSKLRLASNTGGQGASNFPSGFNSFSLSTGSTVEYAATTAQTIYGVSSGYGNLTLTNASTKTAGGSLLVKGSLTNNPGSVFAAGTALSHTFAGNWVNSGSFTASTSTITLNGSSQQTIQGNSTNFYNLVLNNTANNSGGDILLNGVNTYIDNSCTFTDGIMNSTTSNMLVFNNGATALTANNNSFMSGKVRKIGTNAFTFPVGKLTVGYMRCGISAPALMTDAFTAEYFRNSPVSLGSTIAAGLFRLSACEYWNIDRSTGSSNVNVTLSWNALSACSLAAYVTFLSSLSVVHFNGSTWNAYGNNSYTGTILAGTVTWNNVSSFSPFTLGSTSATTNPLPIRFSDIKAYRVVAGNNVEWKNLTEENIKEYVVERSADGGLFSVIGEVTPAANDGQSHQYLFTDNQGRAATYFYRIRAIENSGNFLFSQIVKVEAEESSGKRVDVFPNPVKERKFAIQLKNYQQGDYLVKLLSPNGQNLLSKPVVVGAISSKVELQLPSTIGRGLYFVQISGAGTIETCRILIE